MTPAEELKAIRKRLGLTQVAFGERLGLEGDAASRQVTVARWERGERRPSGTVLRLARTLRLPGDGQGR